MSIQIVKVQVPISTNEEVPQALIYNRDRSIQVMIPVTPELVEKMGASRLKTYHRSEFIDGHLIIHERVADQNW